MLQNMNANRGISGGVVCTVMREQLDQVHRNVLQNIAEVQPFIE